MSVPFKQTGYASQENPVKLPGGWYFWPPPRRNVEHKFTMLHSPRGRRVTALPYDDAIPFIESLTREPYMEPQ